MPYIEDDLLPISALQHLLFCERQAALIHVERVWADNKLTAEGNQLHKKAHSLKPETRDGKRITRSLPLRCLELGLSGQADVIEWEPPDELDRGDLTLAHLIQHTRGADLVDWKVTPIEYKRGKPKSNDCDRVQLCAQALCLEEMLDTSIPRGEIFYGRTRRRVVVEFDATLRDITRQAALRLHELIEAQITPRAVYEKKCDSCSLLKLCVPPKPNARSAQAYLDAITREHTS